MGYEGMCVCEGAKVLATYSTCVDDCRIFGDVLTRDAWTCEKTFRYGGRVCRTLRSLTR